VAAFNLKKFFDFCNYLKIDSKEDGVISLGKQMNGCQKYMMREIAKGLEDDKHFFVVLKGRQQGITTVSLAMDLFYHFMHPGLQGTLITDTEENREQFRSTLSLYTDSLPAKYRIPAVAHNRNLMEFANRSRLFYQVAGTRGKDTLGQGKGITFCHGTETSSWGSEEGIGSLIASFAENNPLRYFLFESTAHGFNHYYDMWTTAKRAKTQKAIFVGWWLKESYSCPQGSQEYKVYWDGKLTADEREWVREIKKIYGVEINSTQIAWWRWKLAEQYRDDFDLMGQNFPPTEDYAFIMSGSNFFSTASCTDATKQAKLHLPDHYRFTMGANFEDTRLIKSTPALSTMKIWEEPVENAYYVIGADPAYGSSYWADRFCIQIFRCYADGIEQVAEFATAELNTYQFAWVLCYFGGLYKNSTLNLEVNGPGQAVLNEIKNLKRQAAAMGDIKGKELTDVLAHMSSYIWRRNDNFGGLSSSIGWITSQGSKERMLNYFKDLFERNMMQVYSKDLLDEMKTIQRDDGSIMASGRNKDDRVMAAGMACAAFAEQVHPVLIAMKMTKAASDKRLGQTATTSAVERNVSNYLGAIGIKA
jgi:hypothetical protein